MAGLDYKIHLRIALVANPDISVPPQYYGGIERSVYSLIKYLMKRGHEVTLFASVNSIVPCHLVPFGYRSGQSKFRDLLNLLTLYYQLLKLRKGFDVIHCFGRLLYLLPLLPLNIIKVQDYACPLNFKKISIANGLSKDTLTFVACSNSCVREGRGGIGKWKIIYSGIDIDNYDCNLRPCGGYLVFLGRFDGIKGAHTAIEVAKAANKQLKLAGTIGSFGKNIEYFKQMIQPQIDGKQIQYVGPVDDYQKNKLLGEASALLFPVEWEEPFGLVMIEAMACGTPVIAYCRGAVPEILTNGLNGYICNSKEEMILAVGRVNEIDRKECRKTVEMRFKAEKVALEYERLYIQLLNNG